MKLNDKLNLLLAQYKDASIAYDLELADKLNMEIRKLIIQMKGD